MGLRYFIKRALFKTRLLLFKTGLLKPIVLLCERFVSDFWRMEYQQRSCHYPYPVWYPHRLDLATWHEHRNSHFLERGVYSNEVISPGDTVLELCSGDGFYSYFFFPKKAKHIDAIDIDQVALAHACEYHSLPNINYHAADVVKDPFPRDVYNVVVWDSAIRRIEKEEINIVLEKIKSVLRPTSGILSCYEIFEDSDNPIEFITPLTAQELIEMLRKCFESVQWRETISPGRHNYYFHCYMGPRYRDSGSGDPRGTLNPQPD